MTRKEITILLGDILYQQRFKDAYPEHRKKSITELLFCMLRSGR